MIHFKVANVRISAWITIPVGLFTGMLAATMLIVAVSRGAKIPGYLADLNLRPALDPQMAATLSQISYWALVTALGSAGLIITVAMARGMLQDKAVRQASKIAAEVVNHG